ncbi:hypothetical protein [Paraburkholderia rhizosphaerae]|uniref:Uncharacterized protein n=1 Tax=Paraburkholderia rhizosphaerae TaxID=480658 RepID=A0A4R8L816_9BURK|nr:hypothetical protein [Paraburkholderia rhizosphaerae]TDY38887.1 hypothetical protein BX592_1293 [Paraburkholderia rhizosphaerae]
MAIVRDYQTFDQLQRISDQIANWKIHDARRYGEKVEYGDWLEFRVAGFIDFVNALSHENGDSEYYFVDVRALARDDFIPTAGDFPAMKLDTRVNEREYFNELYSSVNFIEHVDYAMGYTNEYAFFPLSMNWHIYGLYDIELARIQSRASFPATPFPHDFIPPDEAHRLIRLLD